MNHYMDCGSYAVYCECINIPSDEKDACRKINEAALQPLKAYYFLEDDHQRLLSILFFLLCILPLYL